MALIEIASTTRQIDLAVFDKDGTLVEFDRLWTGKLQRAVAAVMVQAAGIPGLEVALYQTLGVDHVSGKVIAESPLAVATLARCGMVCATVLYQHGLPWHRAETLADQVFMPLITAPPVRADLAPIGDLPALFNRLKRAGLKLAICTSDDRLASQAGLDLLGISHLFDEMVCGDDPFPSKPAPDGLLHLARHFGVDPRRMLMAGDSAGDMLAGRNAGAGLTLGVLSGTGKAQGLAAHADVIVPDIHAIAVAGG